MKAFEGIVIHGQAIGNHFGIATANISVEKKPESREGVYFCECQVEQKKYPGIMHFGELKTFGEGFSIEIHLLDIHENLYEKKFNVKPLKYHREVKKFDNADLLYTQIEEDIIAAKKYFIRQEIIKKWEALTKQEKEKLNKKAFDVITKSEAFKESQTIALYAGTNHELQFAKEICEQYPEKTFLFPKVISKTEMIFAESTYDELIPGKNKILEPSAISHSPLAILDLIITPALAIDKDNIRLGQGGGYYDRCLNTFRGKSLCITPEFTVSEKLPKNKHDQPTSQVIII